MERNVGGIYPTRVTRATEPGTASFGIASREVGVGGLVGSRGGIVGML